MAARIARIIATMSNSTNVNPDWLLVGRTVSIDLLQLESATV
jgi:hypothetical protein